MMKLLFKIELVCILVASISCVIVMPAWAFPEISNLEMPNEVAAGDPFTIKFSFKDSDGDIKILYIRSNSRNRSTAYSFELPDVFGKTEGVVEFQKETTKGLASQDTEVLISVQVKDSKGNRSNTLQKWITLRWR